MKVLLFYINYKYKKIVYKELRIANTKNELVII